MRITKKTLRDAKSGIRRRVNELCGIAAKGGLRAEFDRCFPALAAEQPLSEWELMRRLLSDLLDLAIPPHWHD
jgi:hypothetical protein